MVVRKFERFKSLNSLVKYISAEDAVATGVPSLMFLVLVRVARDECEDSEAHILGLLLLVISKLLEGYGSDKKKREEA